MKSNILKIITLCFLYFIHTSLIAAPDLSALYDESTLEYWRDRYKRSTTRILNEIIEPVLFSNEKRRLANKLNLEFPLHAEGEVRGYPLAFYVPASGDRIVFPALSLKFLDDLCTAYAWLQINGYSLETISEYTAILKYGNPPPGGFPPPLKALHIPENALKDPRVDELALGHFVTARTFILLHEIGHIFYDHQGTLAESVSNEKQADNFAAIVMKRTPLPPLGILVFFLADAHWSGFPASGQNTHPLSGERVRALASYVDDRALAQKLTQLGEFFDDPDIRAGFVATGKAGDLAALAPRRPGELPRRKFESNPGTQENLFSGVYRGEFVQFGEAPEPMPIVLILERRGDHVTGRYSFGLGIGAITDGWVEDNQLYFDWEWAGNYGQGVLEGRNDGSFSGTWGYREARSGAGIWTGRPNTKSN